MSVTYPGLFKARYAELRGRDWIRRVEAEDRQAFIEIGLAATDYGRKGGQARAQAPRDERGRFRKEEATCLEFCM